MKLFYMPGACSLAPHILARELGLPVELEKVDTKAQKTEAGTDYRTVNPKGYVPALRLDDGQVLTEVPVVLQYLADRKPEAGLVPPPGTPERYRAMEWLSYVTSEMHKTVGSLFDKTMPAEWRDRTKARIGERLDFLAKELSSRSYLAGERFTAPDAYLFVVLSWSRWVDLDLSRWPALQQYLARIAARPAVQTALKEEGLA